MEPKRGPGRPPIYLPGERVNLQIRVNAELLVAINEASAEAGVTRVEWITDALMEHLNRDADE